MNVLGLDIGGANLKFCNADGIAHAVPFPMWTDYERLADVLLEVFEEHFAASNPAMLAVTMTAELADCFATRQAGVEFVIDAVAEAFPMIPQRYWLTSGELVSPEDAGELTELVAAANWHAAATWAARSTPDAGAILVDVGSTTTDITPLMAGQVACEGRTDLQRLNSGELVYLGIGRTPLCAVVNQLRVHDFCCGVAAEFFATTADALVVAGLLDEDESATDTADGRPLTWRASANRLCHMVCCDSTDLPDEVIRDMAFQVTSAMTEKIAAGVLRAMERLQNDANGSETPPALLLGGSGAFFAKTVVDVLPDDAFSSVSFLPEMFRRNIAGTLPAFAVAVLAAERCRTDLLPESGFLA